MTIDLPRSPHAALAKDGRYRNGRKIERLLGLAADPSSRRLLEVGGAALPACIPPLVAGALAQHVASALTQGQSIRLPAIILRTTGTPPEMCGIYVRTATRNGTEGHVRNKIPGSSAVEIRPSPCSC